jgi:hypothetical protein
MVKSTGRSFISAISDVVLFAWWYAQGMPELREEGHKGKRLQNEDNNDASDSSFIDDEVQEQLDIIRVLLLRAREHKFRFENLQQQIGYDLEAVEEPKDGNEIHNSNPGVTVAKFKSSAIRNLQVSEATEQSLCKPRDDPRRTNRLPPSRSEIPENLVAFFSKIRHRRYDEVTHALEQDPSLCTEPRDEFGNTPLMLAAQARSH